MKLNKSFFGQLIVALVLLCLYPTKDRNSTKQNNYNRALEVYQESARGNKKPGDLKIALKTGDHNCEFVQPGSNPDREKALRLLSLLKEGRAFNYEEAVPTDAELTVILPEVTIQARLAKQFTDLNITGQIFVKIMQENCAHK